MGSCVSAPEGCYKKKKKKNMKMIRRKRRRYYKNGDRKRVSTSSNLPEGSSLDNTPALPDSSFPGSYLSVIIWNHTVLFILLLSWCLSFFNWLGANLLNQNTWWESFACVSMNSSEISLSTNHSKRKAGQKKNANFFYDLMEIWLLVSQVCSNFTMSLIVASITCDSLRCCHNLWCGSSW